MADSAAAQQYPNLNLYEGTNGTQQQPAEDSKSLLNNAQQTAQNTMDTVKNSQTVQTVVNGPVADKARTEANATKNEFGNLAASRQTPETQTATGQDLTHYHSFFYNLLSWENPRATAITYVFIVLSILTARYVPVSKYALKALYIVLGITAAAEIAGQTLLGQGVSTKLRPRKYYTIPHETLESVMHDGVELVNFFVIEFQRIIFAENVYATIAAFASTFLTYWLIKIMPTWGLFLFFNTVIFLAPLIYINNKELIDEHLGNAQKIVSEQTSQVRSLAAEHTGKAWEASQNAIREYTGKAQEAIGSGKQVAVEKGYVSKETAEKVVPAEKPVHSDDFPSAPKAEPVVPAPETVADPTAEHKTEPLAA